ncbi:alpha/beta fold hydrolase [Aquincola sp. MAHUQ-54]|uniref:Alpha/beta fold hydrolase n=1 Tax=Aquincola agrisoli TaxID=3119538 RepID=A0AAW9Q4M7_9BURK
MRQVVSRLGRHGLAKLFALLLAACVAAGCASLDAQQRTWIFQPMEGTWWGGELEDAELQDVWIHYTPSSGWRADQPVKLHGLWLAQARSDAPVLLYLHGARWDVRGSANRMRRMHDLGFSVLGIDYRGFGRSTAVLPSESMAYQDARAAWDWLARQHPAARRFVFGHSLGGAIAVHLAQEVDDASGLIVENTFTSIRDVFSTMRWGWLPLGPLITQRFEAGDRIADVKAPVLVVHGSDDRLIPPELGRALYERARGPKRFVLVDGGSHHNTNDLGQPQYREAIAELFGLTL